VLLTYFLLELEEKKLCLGIQDSKFRTQNRGLRIKTQDTVQNLVQNLKPSLITPPDTVLVEYFVLKGVCHNY